MSEEAKQSQAPKAASDGGAKSSDQQASSSNLSSLSQTGSQTNLNQVGSQSGTFSSIPRNSPIFTWPLIRRLESAAFMAMFIAVPLFAFRVVDYTARQLALNNAAHELVKDIRRVKEMSVNYDMPITITSARMKTGQNSYLIKSDKKILEEVVLPKGVVMLGEVTFEQTGKPVRPSSFDVTMENRSLLVNVDSSGVASLP